MILALIAISRHYETMDVFGKRREKIFNWMAQESISMVLFEDTETRRDASIRWLTGHPADALLFLTVDRKSLLVPWDINMAKRMANVDAMIPYSDFDRQAVIAAKGAAKLFKLPSNSRIEIPAVTTYLLFLNYVEVLEDYDVICRNGGIQDEAAVYRVIKDDYELDLYRKAADITNKVIDSLEKAFQKKSLKTEVDVALFIEAESRKFGAEGTSFETLAAGPSRSFGIHAFPSFTNASFIEDGLSILDFGIKYYGYSTDVTLTVARGELSKNQEKMISLVEKAYEKGSSMLKAGTALRDIAKAVDSIFAKGKFTMPHALGHGIGLDVHELPSFRNRENNDWVLQKGMVVAMEPGIYDPLAGGCRWENDFIITEKDAEPITKSRIIRI
jgi:Xaa-Pro dipeptidase